MNRVDDFRLRFGRQELVPIVIGGMGVDISTAELALEVARLGGIGHISDAMVQTVSDRRFRTQFVKEKAKLYKYNVANRDKSAIHFDLGHLAEATRMHVGRTMEAKRGDGLIFINTMEKLTMNNPRETLRVRLAAAMDAGIEGITLSAGLHLSSLALDAGISQPTAKTWRPKTVYFSSTPMATAKMMAIETPGASSSQEGRGLLAMSSLTQVMGASIFWFPAIHLATPRAMPIMPSVMMNGTTRSDVIRPPLITPMTPPVSTPKTRPSHGGSPALMT